MAGDGLMPYRAVGLGRQSQGTCVRTLPSPYRAGSSDTETHRKKREILQDPPPNVKDWSSHSLLQAFQLFDKEHMLAVCKKDIMTGEKEDQRGFRNKAAPEA